MKEYLYVREAAALWNVTPRAVTALCKEGKIENARKENGVWVIPADAERPLDHRVKTGAYRKSKQAERLPLPVGISDYRLASSQYYYVDKTMMIKDFIDERPMVSLFTRPRRFGKTLNMDMLRTFFEKTEEDTSVYFKNMKIWKCGNKYREVQGKYPVIFMTFKDVKRNTWEETYEHLITLISEEFQRHSDLLNSERCSDYDKALYQQIVSRQARETDYISALKVLSSMLYKHYGEAAVIIIDEYDTPIQQGYLLGFYESVVSFMRNFFSSGLKDNRNLAYGFLTGILRVAKESIFSGLNNLVVNSVLDKKYSEYFGFTRQEVEMMARYYHREDKMQEICEWYDGYRFGITEIFNPWSVINYFHNACEAKAYWVSTSGNEVIGEILAGASSEVVDQLVDLLQGKSILTYVDSSVIYPQIKDNPSSIYSFLLVCGYLKITGSDKAFGLGNLCQVALPNREIEFVYQSEILNQYAGMIPQSAAIAIQEALFTGDAERLRDRLEKLLETSVSFYDTAKESFYHGLMLGLLATLDNRYQVLSNRESGSGRYDLCLLPKQEKLPGILIELKAVKNGTKDELKKLASDAVLQIQQRQYDVQLREAGVKKVLHFGVAFSGKHVEIVSEWA